MDVLVLGRFDAVLIQLMMPTLFWATRRLLARANSLRMFAERTCEVRRRHRLMPHVPQAAKLWIWALLGI